MANDKKNINELVTEDDDPTAELEALSPRQFSSHGDAASLEAAAGTHDYHQDSSGEAAISELKSDLLSRSETINRLQFDIEQFRAKWNGLETEIQARQKITDDLNHEIKTLRDELDRKDKLLRTRNQTITELKAEIRQRSDEYSELQTSIAELGKRNRGLQQKLDADRSDEARQDRLLLEQQAGELASNNAQIRELTAQVVRTESYADSLRRQLRERTEATDQAEGSREYLENSLQAATSKIVELERDLATANSDLSELRQQYDGLHNAHAEEIRMIRFELGEAEETVAQQELVAEQLASDLVETRSYRTELESMLSKSEEKSSSRIEKLEKENRRLLREFKDYEEKLAAKSEAINCLLAELAKKTQQVESIVEIEDVIHEIDDRMSERIEERGGQDRVTRLLIGTVEGQELRFPLFKDRLTIGRTEQNDIQLKASYVSRRHAVVVTDHETTRVIDWGSKNGVFVNSKRVTELFLNHGDIVTIGTADFRYEELPKRDS
jgi:chromosome segregation ATPase